MDAYRCAWIENGRQLFVLVIVHNFVAKKYWPNSSLCHRTEKAIKYAEQEDALIYQLLVVHVNRD